MNPGIALILTLGVMRRISLIHTFRPLGGISLLFIHHWTGDDDTNEEDVFMNEDDLGIGIGRGGREREREREYFTYHYSVQLLARLTEGNRN